MAVPNEHHITLIAADVNLPYKWVVKCSCQWEGLAHTGPVAYRWIMGHAQSQTLRGNHVFIDVDESELESLRAAAVSAG
jgi:hypothetical protein